MRRKFKRPLTFLLAVLLLFSVSGMSVQAEESVIAGLSENQQVVLMQEDGGQKEDDVGESTSTEENVQQKIPEINENEIQVTESASETSKTEALEEKKPESGEERKQDATEKKSQNIDLQENQNAGGETGSSDQKKNVADAEQKENLSEAEVSNKESDASQNVSDITSDIHDSNMPSEESSLATAEYQKTNSNDSLSEVQAAVNVSAVIQDNIETAGTLNVQISGDQTTGITVEWYKHAEGATNWTKVERHKVTGNSYNVSKDGTALNVALDKGARCFYKVQVKDTSGQLMAESEAVQVSYYNQLENGDFETPETSQTTGYQPYYSNGTPGLIWKTTASDKQIEYVSASTGKMDKISGKTHAQQSLYWHKVDAAAHGTQFAELNANEPGALYQDVLTTPGAKLYWQIYHRGRGTRANDSRQKDTMYVVIMSTKLAKQYKVETQRAVQDVITNVQNNTGKYPGASVATITDDNVKWYRHTGDYDVRESQYLTRFFFVAGETAYDKNGGGDAKEGTVGNHLDNVSFSETLPEPNPDTGHLQITKTVRGLPEDDAASYQMQVKITGPDQQAKTVTLRQFSRNEDGSYSCTYTETNVAAGTYRIEEILPADLPDYRVDATFNGEDGTKGTVTVQDQKTAQANIINTYVYNIVSPPTGVTDKAVSFGILTGAALGFGALYLFGVRRKRW